MVFVRFLKKGLDGRIAEAIGSDGFFRLGARKTLQNQIADAKQELNALRNSVQPSYIGFKICRGNILQNKEIGLRKTPRVRFN